MYIRPIFFVLLGIELKLSLGENVHIDASHFVLHANGNGGGDEGLPDKRSLNKLSNGGKHMGSMSSNMASGWPCAWQLPDHSNGPQLPSQGSWLF